MQEHLDQNLLEAKKKIEWLAKIQHNSTFLEDDYLDGYKGVFLIFYQRVYKDSQTSDKNVSGSSPGSGDGREGTEPTKAAILGQDEMELALEFMATVQAYFKGIHLRFRMYMAV